jgi:predicted alpha/beta-hydrolase family hydrolase
MDLTLYSSEDATAALVLAHGAGSGQQSPFMVRFARGMASRGIHAATFDFPYMVAGKHVPDPAPVLERSWREVIERARVELGNLPLVIGGKSMGGRIASQVAAQAAGGITGLVFLGYPLHPPGKPAQRRDAHLPAITEPMLFVQGARDAFGTAAEIAALLPTLKRATLHEVAGGDHSFKITKQAGMTQDTVMENIMDVVARWIIHEVQEVQ